ncbi:uncharacterized protein EV420DRAFT_517511 [Desarmillaria tabescens]|uniref:Uncharacterized protein n=1 Tax=Armillaria tabescens TaxID=1929756 RepID=A0AA39K9Y2_ARMTA|nr:uncharacterized protein EV420DRAFT_517511 [Desarmillaria tabescens]KAK0457289.1 hypothetical protein EV420DRAFT_517511 [Desarmillaria tabescens]
MDQFANPWSPPPPSYSTFPNDRPGPSNEQTPLNHPKPKRFRRCSYTLKVLIVLLLLAAFTWHCVDDYSNTHRTDVQERIRHREELERLRRIEHEDAQRKQAHELEDEERRKTFEEEDEWRRLAHGAEDEQRRLAHEKEDRERKEEKEREGRRKRAGLIWHDLTAEEQCLSYETRMYHADLMNIPYGEDAESWCMNTAIDIHGVTYDHPDFCTKERQDGAIRIVGHWTATSNEPTCKTWWGNHKKKGCYGSHKMRVEAQMLNYQGPWDNWAEMCFSTPSEIARKTFAHPDTCEKGIFGIFGSWFIDVDESECP